MEQPVCFVCTWNTSILLSRDFIPIRILASSMSYLAGLAIWKNHRGSSSQSCILYGPCHEAEGNHSWRIEKLPRGNPRKFDHKKNKWKENIIVFCSYLKSDVSKKNQGTKIANLCKARPKCSFFWSHPKWNCKQSSNESKSTAPYVPHSEYSKRPRVKSEDKGASFINLKHNRILNWVFRILPKNKAMQSLQSSKFVPNSGHLSISASSYYIFWDDWMTLKIYENKQTYTWAVVQKPVGVTFHCTCWLIGILTMDIILPI